MVKILTLTNKYPPHHLGGYELSCADVMRNLAARGHEVTVLTTTMRRPGIADPPGERAAGVRRELEWYWDDHELTRPPVPSRFAQEWRNRRRLLRTLREVRPDVVSVWNVGAMSLGLLTEIARQRVPMVFSVCDEWPVYGPNLDAWGRLFRSSATRRLAGRALTALTRVPTVLPDDPWPGAYCFITDAMRRAAEGARSWTLPWAAVVYNGISHVDFPVNEAPPEPRPWRWRVLFVGRVERRKGVATVVRALAHLPAEARLVIDGPVEPAYLPELRAVIEQEGVADRVTLAESRRAELRDVYAGADVLVFPSEWEEPFGLVPIEAMACDTPVVATGTGGSKEFLGDGANCVLYERGDPAALARALHVLADHPALRATLVSGGRRTAEMFGTEQLSDEFEAWHLFAAGGFAGPPPADRPSPTSPGPRRPH